MYGDVNLTQEFSSEQLYAGIVTPIPSVEFAMKELRQCEEDDFWSTSQHLQLLHHAILVQSSTLLDSGGCSSIDISEVFCCIEEMALRYHQWWNQLHCESSSDEIISESNEEASWQVWEEAMWALAALAKSIIGPAWRHQIINPHNRSSLYAAHPTDDSASTSMSTVGMASASSPKHPRNKRQNSTASDRSDRSMTDQVADTAMAFFKGDSIPPEPSPPPFVPLHSHLSSYPPVPQPLPPAMLHFAANATSLALPPIRDPQSALTLCLFENVPILVKNERKWLLRRQRLGQPQRQIVLSLCCFSNGHSQQQQQQQQHQHASQWTIPGAQTPVGSLLRSWLHTCEAGWPNPKPTEETADRMRITSIQLHPTSPSDTPLSSNKQRHPDTLQPIYCTWSSIASIGAIDWWYTLQVARATADLVSFGWRPSLRMQSGKHVVLSLLKIAKYGLLSSPHHFNPNATRQEAREEQLTAVLRRRP